MASPSLVSIASVDIVAGGDFITSLLLPFIVFSYFIFALWGVIWFHTFHFLFLVDPDH